MFVFCIACSFFALLAAFPNVFWLFIVFRLFVGISIGKFYILALKLELTALNKLPWDLAFILITNDHCPYNKCSYNTERNKTNNLKQKMNHYFWVFIDASMISGVLRMVT